MNTRSPSPAWLLSGMEKSVSFPGPIGISPSGSAEEITRQCRAGDPAREKLTASFERQHGLQSEDIRVSTGVVSARYKCVLNLKHLDGRRGIGCVTGQVGSATFASLPPFFCPPLLACELNSKTGLLESGCSHDAWSNAVGN